MDNKKEAPKAKTKKPAAIEETEVKKGPKWGILIPLIVILTICGSVGGTVLATHFLASKTEQAGSSVKRNAGTGKISDDENWSTYRSSLSTLQRTIRPIRSMRA